MLWVAAHRSRETPVSKEQHHSAKAEWCELLLTKVIRFLSQPLLFNNLACRRTGLDDVQPCG
jgi:hypothetical protein